MRWAALAWLAVWIPSYTATWGWRNFLQLCDIAVIITAVGLWRGSSLLLSSQALSSLVVDALWTIDAGGRLLTGHHLIGGTAYMWDASFPLPVRLLSLFHVFWPVLLLWSLTKVGYDRRALALQTAIAAVALVLTRIVGDPAKNANFAFRDPFTGSSLGPAPVHLALSVAVLALVAYLPSHLLFSRLYRRRRQEQSRPAPPRRGR
jgi:hypothetical protein